jgi:hypothetical protein
MAVTTAALRAQLAEQEEWRRTIADRAMATAERRGMTDDVAQFLRDHGMPVVQTHRYSVRVTREIAGTQYAYVEVRAADEDGARAEAVRYATRHVADGYVAWGDENDDESVEYTNIAADEHFMPERF